MSARAEARPGVLRCAVYTRKSSEEGLEQSFNSLHAQRAACEAYVASQAGEGWTLLPELYDDGGFSGGSMDRPALHQLLLEVRAGRVDVVVVYKVDRLTRSLVDFARIVDTFDAASTAFVSVTQAFNTTTSMGRLTLNVLLSFAQFEREVTGERIRDKIALSKARGMWMGGILPLGYDRAPGGGLQVNDAEAEQVRGLYRRYLKLGSVNRLRERLEAEGVRSKSWTRQDGRAMGGAPLGRGALYHLLANRLYLGEIVHKDQRHPGLHDAILDPKLFEAVQKKLASQAARRRSRPTASTTSPLTGRIFDAEGGPMGPSFAYGRQGRRYRYYISAPFSAGDKPQAAPGVIRRVAADGLEAVLVRRLARLAERPELTAEDLPDLIQRLELRRGDTQLVLSAEALFGLDHPELAFEDLQTRLEPGERAVREGSGAVRISLPKRMQLRGGRTTLCGAEGARPRIDPGLVAALRSAHQELAKLSASPLTPAVLLSHAVAPATHHRRQLARLAFLAPDLQQMILQGRQPSAMTLRTLLKHELPLAWADQRVWFDQIRRQDDAPRGAAS